MWSKQSRNNVNPYSNDALIAKMTDDEFYYGYLGKNAMSSSNIKLLTKSPKHYKFITTYGQEQELNRPTSGSVHPYDGS
jgi:hypothetical protein